MTTPQKMTVSAGWGPQAAGAEKEPGWAGHTRECLARMPCRRPQPPPTPPRPPQPQSSFSDARSPPLEGLDNHAERFQVDGFNRALSSRSGGKGFGRLLTFGKSPKPAASPATPENLTLSMDDMLLYSEVRGAVARAAVGRGGCLLQVWEVCKSGQSGALACV